VILDTNALSAWAEGQPEIRPKLASASRVVLPVIALGEYLFGISQSRYHERYEQWLTQIPERSYRKERRERKTGNSSFLRSLRSLRSLRLTNKSDGFT
jgi:predicted nucleic acid-binding protein